jgi:type IV pilus assembly protein PilC
MADKENKKEIKGGDSSRETSSSSLREALISKVRGGDASGEVSPHVTPFEIGSAAPEEASSLSRPISLGGPGYLDRAIFCRQFATLIEVGIPVLKALQMLGRRTSHAKLRDAIVATAKGVEEGQTIHQAMASHVKVYSSLVVNIIRIGELGGLLEDSLVRLAEIMESKARIKRQLTSAMMYPCAVLTIAFGILLVMLGYVIPQFGQLYEEMGQELPGMTRFILGLSNFVQHAWWLILILLVLGAFGLRVWGNTAGGKWAFSWLALHVPIMRGVNQKIGVARSTRTLGGLVVSGIPLLEALSITAQSNENVLIAEALEKVRDQVEKGGRMSEPLAEAGVFPDLVVDMIGIGEETGTLDRMLTKIADIYDGEANATLNGLASIIEPILIVVLGMLVFFLALAVLLPYFNLGNVLV